MVDFCCIYYIYKRKPTTFVIGFYIKILYYDYRNL